MLREGPIPRFLHGLIEYAAAVVFLIAPFVLDFDSGAATAASIIAGVVVLFLASATEGPVSLINYVPVPAHVVFDFLLAGLLIATPFILGFSDETNATAFFIVIGALHLLVTVGTRFKPRDKPEPEPEAAPAAEDDRALEPAAEERPLEDERPMEPELDAPVADPDAPERER